MADRCGAVLTYLRSTDAWRAEVQQRVRKHKDGATVRARSGGNLALVDADGAAISSLRLALTGPPSLSDRIGRWVFAVAVITGLALWMMLAAEVLAWAGLGLTAGLVVVTLLRLLEEA